MHSKQGLLKRATLFLLFATTRSSVSVLVHIPHASFALLRALSGPLSSTACVFPSFRSPPGPLSLGLLSFPRRAFRGAAFSSNFREQLSGAALQNSFGEPFWGIGFKNRSFRAIALDSSFGEQLWQAIRSNFQEQLL